MLRAPLGVGADGPLWLDLVAHGPHALIGGTSGSGKSELLQTLVCSLAAHYPATRLNFLFVDYKGGAATAELRELPHTVGYVTNLDPSMALRSRVNSMWVKGVSGSTIATRSYGPSFSTKVRNVRRNGIMICGALSM